MKIIALYLKHDGNITVYDNGRLHIVELEKFYEYKSFPFIEGGGWWPPNSDKYNWHSYKYLGFIIDEILYFIEKNWGIKNNFDLVLYNWIKDKNFIEVIKSKINHKQIKHIDHQYAHANCAYFQSPFEESHVFTIDGWGNDGCFHVYKFNKEKNQILKKFNISLGTPYSTLGRYLPQIRYKEFHEDGKRSLSATLAGKVMGLCGYGKIQINWIEPIKNLFLSNSFNIECIENLFKKIKINKNNITEEIGADLAASFQYAFESVFLDLTHDLLTESKNICISGGCALNILLCEKIRKKYNKPMYIPSNPNDCGISVGMTLSVLKPNIEKRIESVYLGMPFILDKINKKNKKINNKDIIKILLDKKFVGIIRGNCECGPRALGNRSIICLPTILNLKEKLNFIKKRENFRPFGVIVCEDDAEIYFDFANQTSPYMNFSPCVRTEWKELLSEIVHVDGTCRIQTISKKHYLYDILKTIKKETNIGVIVNTSLNIKGEPLVTRFSKALYILKNTALDYLIIENFLFNKLNSKIFI